MSLLSRFRAPSVDAVEARRLVDGGATLIDVRESNEWRAGHAPQARHVPLSRLEELGRRVPTDRPVVVVCRTGSRSSHVTKALVARGVEAVNLSGGMYAWKATGAPVVDGRGRPGVVA